MAAIFSQPNSIFCFYCQTGVTPTPRNPRSFRCPHCDCWNRYDEKGEILSDEPAMHDENLNARSFAKRASPRKDRLPSMYGSAVFCHTCQTNQMLVTHLLSNYLPPPNDSDYERYAEALPEYRRSIEVRYPPICANCQPAVEEEIRKRDQMARVRALGSALRQTKGTDNRRHTSATQKERDKLECELQMWRIRGCLWAGSMVCAIAGYASVAMSYDLIRLPNFMRLATPAFVLISIFWTAWEPTYATFRRYQFQGRAVRVDGKKQHNILQIVVWLSRLCTACLLVLPKLQRQLVPIHLWDDPHSQLARAYCSTLLACEVMILLWSILVLKVQHPPPVRLVDSKGHLRQSSVTPSAPSSRDVTPAVPEPDLLAALSLSNNPVLAAPPAHNPIFGIPSLSNAAPLSSPPLGQSSTIRSPGLDVDMDDDDERDPDAMDIDPASPMKKVSRDDGSWLHPQRFFAPEEPTGLENLFARTIRLVDASEPGANGAQSTSNRRQALRKGVGTYLRDWRIWLALCIVPLVAIGYNASSKRR